MKPGHHGELNFLDMTVMPVVHFDYLASSVYLNPRDPAFDKNIFVALQHSQSFENGTKVKHFQEFVPCNDVQNEDGYLNIDYKTLFYGNQ